MAEEVNSNSEAVRQLIKDRQAAYQRHKDPALRSAANVIRKEIRAEAKKIRGVGQEAGFTAKGKRRKNRHRLETSVQIKQEYGVNGVSYRVGPMTSIAHLVIRGHKAPENPITPHPGWFSGGAGAKALSIGPDVMRASSMGGIAKGNPFVHRAYDSATHSEAINAARVALSTGIEESA